MGIRVFHGYLALIALFLNVILLLCSYKTILKTTTKPILTEFQKIIAIPILKWLHCFSDSVNISIRGVHIFRTGVWTALGFGVCSLVK